MAKPKSGGRKPAMNRNAGVKPQIVTPPQRPRDPPVRQSPGLHKPTAVDRDAARIAGIPAPAKGMAEAERHMVTGKTTKGGIAVGKVKK